MTETLPLGLRVELRQSRPMPLDLRLECGAGEIVALVGPSGAGKTTVLRSIAGLSEVAHGRVQCGDEVWLDTDGKQRVAPHLRQIGMVFQAYALHAHLSARGNVQLGLGSLPPAEQRTRAEDWLQRLGVAELGDRHMAQLSGGQQQRVAIARALAREPRLLLLDEPLSAVDLPVRQAFAQQLVAICRTQLLAVIWVTHDLDEAARVADRICLMDQGRMLQFAKPNEVLHHPASLAAARAVGIDNLLAGRVGRSEQGHLEVQVGALRAAVRVECAVAEGAQVTACIPSHGWQVERAQEELRPGWLRATLHERWTTRGQDRGTLQLENDLQIASQLGPAVADLPPGSEVHVRLADRAVHVVAGEA